MLAKAYRLSLACFAAWGCLSMAKEQGSQKEVEILLCCALYVAEVGQIESQRVAEVKNSNPKVPVVLMKCVAGLLTMMMAHSLGFGL